jgi:hypothetical protein
MTYDELLTKIDSVFYEEEGGMQLDLAGFNNQYRAIRAVVELHKPVMQWSGGYDGEENELWEEQCQECSSNGFSQMHPCPTIEAIEKELG